MYALNPTSSTWSALVNLLLSIGSMYLTDVKSNVVSYFNNQGITSVGGYSIDNVANAIGTLSGATSVILATIRLMQAVNYSGVYSAHQAGKTLANVDYVIAYQGSWYTYSVSEPGWSSNYIYTPATVYGTGTLYSY